MDKQTLIKQAKSEIPLRGLPFGSHIKETNCFLCRAVRTYKFREGYSIRKGVYYLTNAVIFPYGSREYTSVYIPGWGENICQIKDLEIIS